MKTNKQKIGAKRSGIIAAVALLVTVMMVFSVLPGAFNEASGDLKEYTVSGSQDLGITPENAQPQLIQEGGPSQVMKFTAVGDYTITSYKKTVGGETSEQLWFEDGEWKLEGGKLKFTNEDDLTIIATNSSLDKPDENGQIGKIFAISVYFNAVTADSSLYFYSTIQVYDVTLGEHVYGTLGEEEKDGPTNFPMNLDQNVVVHFDEYYVLDDYTGMEQVGEPQQKDDGLYYTFKVDKNWEPSPDAPDAKRQITAVRMYDVTLGKHVFGDLDGKALEGEVDFEMKSYQKLIVHFEKGYTLDESIGMKQVEDPFVEDGVEYYTFMVDEDWTAPVNGGDTPAKRQITAVQVFDVTLDRNVIGKLGNEVIQGYKNIKMKAGEKIVITFNEGYVLGDAVGMKLDEDEDDALVYTVDETKTNHAISALKLYKVDIGENVKIKLRHSGVTPSEDITGPTSVIITLRSWFEYTPMDEYELEHGGMFESVSEQNESTLNVAPRADTHWISVNKIEKPVWVYIGEGVDGIKIIDQQTQEEKEAEIKYDDQQSRYFEMPDRDSFVPTYGTVSDKPQKYDPDNSKGIVPNDDGTFSLEPEAEVYNFNTKDQTKYIVTVSGFGIGARLGGSQDYFTMKDFGVYENQYLEVEVYRGHEVYTNPGITVEEIEKETRYYVNPAEPNHVILGTHIESGKIKFDEDVLNVFYNNRGTELELKSGEPVYEGEELKVIFKDNLNRKHAVKSLTGLKDLSGKEYPQDSEKRPVDEGGDATLEDRRYLVLADFVEYEIETAPLYKITFEIENATISADEAFKGTEITFQTDSKLFVINNPEVNYEDDEGDNQAPLMVQDEVYTFTMPAFDVNVTGDSDIRTMYFAAIQTSKTIKDVSINGQPTWNISVFNASFGIWLYPGENQVTYTLETGYTGTAQLYCMEFFTGKYTMLPGNVFDPTEIDSVLMDIPGEFPAEVSSFVKVVFLTLAVTDAVPVPTYEVSFDANGGEGMMDPVKVEAGEYVLPGCAFEAPEGTEFAGWSLTKDGEIVEKNDVTENVTVYATWKDAVEPQPPVPEFSENVLVSIKSTGDGNVYVILTALDGRPIPGGEITVYLNYTVYNEKIDDYVDKFDAVTVDVKESQNASEIVPVTVTGAPNYSLASSVVAAFAAGGTDYRSDVVQFSPVTAGPEEFVKPEA